LKKILLPMLIIAIAACAAKPEIPELPVGSYVDGIYTAPFGAFSMDMREWVDLKTVKENLEPGRVSTNINFRDKEGYEYKLSVSFLERDKDPEKILSGFFENAKSQNRKVQRQNTPAGENCLTETQLIGDATTQDGYAIMTVVLVRNDSIFELNVRTLKFKEAPKAFEASGKGMEKLWGHSLLRGQLLETEDFMPGKSDARMPVFRHMLDQAAKKFGYQCEQENGVQPIIHISKPSKTGTIILNIGVKAVPDHLITTEFISCPAEDKVEAEQMLKEVFEEVDKYAKFEKINFIRIKK
jgi:hypothetical protein